MPIQFFCAKTKSIKDLYLNNKKIPHLIPDINSSLCFHNICWGRRTLMVKWGSHGISLLMVWNKMYFILLLFHETQKEIIWRIFFKLSHETNLMLSQIALKSFWRIRTESKTYLTKLSLWKFEQNTWTSL